MKRFLAFSVVIFAGFFSVPMPFASAAQRDFGQHVSIEKILEFTLTQIKDSLTKVQQQNEQIAFENDVLRQSLQGRQKDRNFPDLKVERSIDGSPFPDPQGNQFSRNSDQNLRVSRTNELIAIFEQDINQLTDKSRFLDSKLDGKTFDSSMRLLHQREDMGTKNLARLRKRYETLVKSNTAYEEIIERSKLENDGLR